MSPKRSEASSVQTSDQLCVRVCDLCVSNRMVTCSQRREMQITHHSKRGGVGRWLAIAFAVDCTRFVHDRDGGVSPPPRLFPSLLCLNQLVRWKALHTYFQCKFITFHHQLISIGSIGKDASSSTLIGKNKSKNKSKKIACEFINRCKFIAFTMVIYHHTAKGVTLDSRTQMRLTCVG